MPLWLITTDIADPRRLRRAARVCERYGERIQESVYQVELDAEHLYALQADLARIIDVSEDTIRYYPICGHDLQRSRGEGLCRGLAGLPGHWLI